MRSAVKLDIAVIARPIVCVISGILVLVTQVPKPVVPWHLASWVILAPSPSEYQQFQRHGFDDMEVDTVALYSGNLKPLDIHNNQTRHQQSRDKRINEKK